jgi:hypothetical protein
LPLADSISVKCAPSALTSCKRHDVGRKGEKPIDQSAVFPASKFACKYNFVGQYRGTVVGVHDYGANGKPDIRTKLLQWMWLDAMSLLGTGANVPGYVRPGLHGNINEPVCRPVLGNRSDHCVQRQPVRFGLT